MDICSSNAKVVGSNPTLRSACVFYSQSSEKYIFLSVVIRENIGLFMSGEKKMYPFGTVLPKKKLFSSKSWEKCVLKLLPVLELMTLKHSTTSINPAPYPKHPVGLWTTQH